MLKISLITLDSRGRFALLMTFIFFLRLRTVNVSDAINGFPSLKTKLLTESDLTIYHSMHENVAIPTILK